MKREREGEREGMKDKLKKIGGEKLSKSNRKKVCGREGKGERERQPEV